jgi:hypothetical protein
MIALLPIYIIKFGIKKNLFFIFLIFFIYGLISIYYGSNTAPMFYKIFVGAVLSYFFYYYVVVDSGFEIEQLFKWYLKGCYIVCLIGAFQYISFFIGFDLGTHLFYIFNKWNAVVDPSSGLRVNSVFMEPTYFATTISPAIFISLYNIFSKEPYYLNKRQGVLIIVVSFLSFSSIGIVGIFISMVLLTLSYGFVRYLAILLPIGYFSYLYIYNNVDLFRDRIDGLVSMFAGEEFKLGKTNGSSFILYNNYTVALKNFLDHPIFGGGLGSHISYFNKFSLANGFTSRGFNNNGLDASSMFLRLMSETGLFGLGIFFYIIIKGYVKRNENYLTYHWLVSNSVLVLILLNLFRQGNYFLNGFPFFVILYYYNAVSYRNYKEEQNLITD